MPPPINGVLWYRADKDAPFRKYIAEVKSGKLTLNPETMTFIRRSVTIDLSKFFIQLLPPAKVTVRGSAPAAVPSPNGLPSGPFKQGAMSRNVKSEADRFHSVEAYLSFVPKTVSNPQEGGKDRVVLRARDSVETLEWFRLLLNMGSGDSQTKEQSFPFGNPLEPVKEAAATATSKTSSSAKTGAADGDACGSSTEHGTSGDEGNASRGANRAGVPRTRAHSKKERRASRIYEDIPFVKTSTNGDNSPPATPPSIPPPAEWTLTVEEASTDDETSLMQKGGRRKRLLSSTRGEMELRWTHPWEKVSFGETPVSHQFPTDDDTLSLEALRRRSAYLKTVWGRCSDVDNELLHRKKERQPLETDFAAATISSADHGDRATHLFDQADQRTIATCKAAIVRNGVPATLLLNGPASSPHSSLRSGEGTLCLINVDDNQLRIECTDINKCCEIRLLDVVCLLPEDVVESHEEPPSMTSKQVSTSSSRSGQSGDVSGGPTTANHWSSGGLDTQQQLLRRESSKMLRRLRLSPTIAATADDDPSIRSPSETDPLAAAIPLPASMAVLASPPTSDLNSPGRGTPVLQRSISDQANRGGNLTLVLPPATAGVLASTTFRLHVYYHPNKDLAVDELSCRMGNSKHLDPIVVEGLQKCTIGFEYALERKAVQRILIDGHAKQNALTLAKQNDVSAVSQSALYDYKKSSADDVIHDSGMPEEGYRSEAAAVEFIQEPRFFGAYDAMLRDGAVAACTGDHQKMARLPRESLLGSHHVITDHCQVPLERRLNRELVLDCLQYETVQLYLHTAKKTF